MELQEAINILERHNKWRLGAEIPMMQPKQITEAINVVLKYVKKTMKKLNGKWVHIYIPNIYFTCPYCDKQYCDDDEKILNKINKNKQMCTYKKCECGQKFGVTYNYMGNIVSFK